MLCTQGQSLTERLSQNLFRARVSGRRYRAPQGAIRLSSLEAACAGWRRYWRGEHGQERL